ncbi:MAG: VWA domain-containing protein, partial [Clostridia bacterium]|nr:VWA domain-containing protein [Clostridia bacterium]
MLQNVLQKFLQKQISDKRKRLRFIAILLILSLCVSAEVFWSLRQTGIALAGTAHCGLTEHTHTSECTETCTLEEHTHAVSCYSDENADVETKAMWELSLCGVPYSNHFAADLLEVAKTQLGYTESTANFSVDESGNRNGYTRYGAWYGNPYGQWTAMFVSFCLYYTGVPIGVIPMHAGAESMRIAWEDESMYQDSFEYSPQAGDLMFLDTDADGSAEHVAIVSAQNGTTAKVILGDLNDKVEECSYSTDDSAIMGYVNTASIPEYMSTKGVSRVERSVALPVALDTELTALSSDSQIINYGGANVADDGTRVSKTIAGTGIENIFDITLTVETQQKIEKVYKEPDMAVVIVMDISNTMNSTFGSTDRYSAAMEAAADFIKHFSETSGEVSKIGYVAFNTSAHKIFDLQTCNTEQKAAQLISKMEYETDIIIHDAGYASSNTRYTNVEAGLKMGWDMIKDTHQEHKYIIFLSDGFPTTYLKNHTGTDYIGYSPVSGSGTPGKDGVFYDAVWKNYLNAGRSYSDKAAIYARQMATGIKNDGGTI